MLEPSAIEVATVRATVADENVLPGRLAVDETQVRFVNRGVAHTVTFDFLDTGEL